MVLKDRSKKSFLWALGVIFLGVFLLTPPVWQLRGGSVSIETGDKEAQVGENHEGWLSIGEISQHTVHAFITAEDARFYQHSGVDMKAIWDSIRLNWKHKKYMRGGSTITQQVVKLAFLGPEKTLFRKIREGLGALLLEVIVDKEQILEWYLNLVPMGGDIRGVFAASKYYFDEEPSLLTVQKSIQLALILPRPTKGALILRKKELTVFGHKRFYQIVKDMHDYGYLSVALKENVLATGNFGKPIEMAQATPLRAKNHVQSRTSEGEAP